MTLPTTGGRVWYTSIEPSTHF
uniref:Uncharacterized protein n=1 Tax=Amphimedon queenslandica TaxID=400682 RepID=A0A1X7UA36_AMPQE